VTFKLGQSWWREKPLPKSGRDAIKKDIKYKSAADVIIDTNDQSVEKVKKNNRYH